MKFLVLGCNGMAGHLISLYLHEQGHDVTGFARTGSPLVKSIEGDAVDFTLIKDIILKGKYDTVVNCIGILNRYAGQHKDNAVLMNSYLPHFLADITSETPTQIVHMSTDCVFSGKRGGYTEDDLPDGETFYDRSKALGELDDGKNVTFRNSIVGPDIKAGGIGLMNWFMQQKGPSVNGFTKSLWTGQTTLQLAKTIEQAAEERIFGLYNIVPDSCISKYDLLKLFNRHMRNNELEICPVDGIEADKSLKRTRFGFEYYIPDYETMVSETAEWMKRHAALYPHYNL